MLSAPILTPPPAVVVNSYRSTSVSSANLERYLYSSGHESDDESSEPNLKCVICKADTSAPVYYCTKCAENLCEKCWSTQQRLHEPEKGLKHERSLPSDAKTVHEVLHIPGPLTTGHRYITDIQGDHMNNMWFGVSQNETQDCILSEGTAYNSLLLESPTSSPLNTYPGVASFVGGTGAGKSALVNLLIRFSSSRPVFDKKPWAIPVVGQRNSFCSTSANVHLYADPNTVITQTPTLYADCEGMGGTANPTAMRTVKTSVEFEQPSTHPLQRPSWFKRKIEWEQQDPNGPKLARQDIAAKLYPRILYIFSDVIVYVLVNRKRFQEALLHLVQWAHNAMEQSYNKPALPHAIIAFSNREDHLEPELYDVEHATEILMDKVKDIRTMPQFQTYIEYWDRQPQGKQNESKLQIDSGEALLRCYYSKVRVVHFPSHSEPTMMHKQTIRLYDEISLACKESQESRAAVGMKLNAATVPLYVRTALSQFASGLNKPFDFGEAWFTINHVSFNFSGTILSLAKLAKDHLKLNGIDLWDAVGDFVASCFFLNSCRTNILASPGRLLSKHRKECRAAASKFWHKFWPCQEGSTKHGFCTNGPDGHTNHQFYSKSESYHARGEHKASHTEEQFQKYLESRITKKLAEMQEEVGLVNAKHKSDYLRTVSQLHQKNVSKLYGKMHHLDKCISHSICLWCLDEAPEHSLPCGHVICSTCLNAVGQPRTGGFFELKSCPLTEHNGSPWAESWIGAIKPDQAGTRIMSLDGGGIRGIVQLEILMKIQKQLGKIPIREFFDLIVGTSAGGIIALGIGPAEMDVDKCKEKFEEFTTQGFATHKLTKLPWIGRWIQYIFSAVNHGQYLTEPLEAAFKNVFPAEQLIFGGVSQRRKVPTKVAITTTTRRSRVVVLSNYNRKSPKSPLYHFHRPDPENEMMLWEAARATSAAPTYFSPFSHTLSEQVYLDGGLYHNNPIRVAYAESKAIWPNNRASHPDILLSLGTGFDKSETKVVDTPSTAEALLASENPEHFKDQEKKLYIKMLMSLGIDHVMNGLDCEQTWHEWLQVRTPEQWNERRYRRLTVQFDDPVELDAVEDIGKCRKAVEKDMKDSEIRSIADQLVASCFYYHFEQSDITKSHDGGFGCQGKIECRLTPGKNSSISKLGEYLNELRKPGGRFTPSFMIKEAHREHAMETEEIRTETIQKMIEKGEFSMMVPVRVSSELAETEILMHLREDQQMQDLFPISGFPRKLQQDHEVIFEEKRNTSLRLVRLGLLRHISALRKGISTAPISHRRT